MPLDAESREENERPIAHGPLRIRVPAVLLGLIGTGAVYGGLTHPYWPLVVTGVLLLLGAGSAVHGVRRGVERRWLILALVLLLAALIFLAVAAPQVNAASS